MARTNIPHVNLLFECVLESEEQLLSFVYGPSKYSSVSPREGIVVRLSSQRNYDDKNYCSNHNLCTSEITYRLEDQNTVKATAKLLGRNTCH